MEAPRPPRQFYPEDIYPSYFNLDDIEVKRGGFVHLACPGSNECLECNGHHSYHPDQFVVTVDGAYSDSHRTGARSSIGVYWGEDNPHNTSRTLDFLDHHTNQVAELESCIRALIDATINNIEKLKMSKLVIKSDSEYVVRGVTESIPIWKENGWKKSKGSQVANKELFQEIDDLTEKLERHIIIKFWHVPREYNRMADWLAKSALK